MKKITICLFYSTICIHCGNCVKNTEFSKCNVICLFLGLFCTCRWFFSNNFSFFSDIVASALSA